MKKIIALLCTAVVMLTCLVSCGDKGTGEDDVGYVKTISLDSLGIITEQEQEDSKEKIKGDKKYNLTIPASAVEAEFQGDLNSYAETYGYELKENSDGTVTLKMKGTSYSLLLSRMGMKVIKELAAFVDSGDFPYIVEIGDYSSDFSHILLLVKPKKFQSSDTKEQLSLLVGQCGLYYQTFTHNKDKKCEVIFADYKTGDILARETYTN